MLSQGFRTGSEEGGYRLQGIGVNLEGSGNQAPDNATTVSVAVHADSGGKPGAKLFDLISPGEYPAGEVSFFEAPRGTRLEPSTDYVLVWTHNGGSGHRLQRTAIDAEDSGKLAGFSIADVYYVGADAANLSADSGSNALEIAVYTLQSAGGNASGRPVVLMSAEGPGILAADTWRIADVDGLPYTGSSGFRDRRLRLRLRVDPGRRRDRDRNAGGRRLAAVPAGRGRFRPPDQGACLVHRPARHPGAGDQPGVRPDH